MQDSWILIEQAINKAVQKGAFNLAEVQSILQAMGEIQHILNVKTKEQSDDGGTN